VVAKAGNADLLVQNFTYEDQHSKLSTPQYAALFAAMVYKEPCRFLSDFQPAAAAK
jgi:hypothetical protein